MEIRVVRQNFIDSLNFINKISISKTGVSILSNVLIEATSGKVKLTSTNLEETIIALCGAEVLKDGLTTVNLRTLTDFIVNLKSDIVSIELKENLLNIFDDKSNISLNTIPYEEFPSIPAKNDESFLDIPSIDFADAIDRTTFSTSQDSSKAILTGVLFEVDKDIHLVGIDGFRLSSINIDFKSFRSKEKELLVIPSSSLNNISKIIREMNLSNDSCVTLSKVGRDNQIVFEIDNVSFITRVIDGKYPDYSKIIPADFESNFVINTADFIDSVKLTSIFKFKDVSKIYFDILTKDKKIKFNSSLAEIGSAVSTVDLDVIDGKDNRISYNAKYVMDFLVHCNSDKVEVNCINASMKKATKFTEVGNSKYFHLIMPIMDR